MPFVAVDHQDPVIVVGHLEHNRAHVEKVAIPLVGVTVAVAGVLVDVDEKELLKETVTVV